MKDDTAARPSSDTAPATALAASTHRYVSDRELAELTSISRHTWQAMRYAKEGPPYRKVGKRVVYLLEDVFAWIEAQPGAGHGRIAE